ncbi:MAG: hypothetical protein J5I28_00330 [Acidimicrobiales bacterium]|nr:hypothetical protein [Acidimicrobiales bacterium]HLV91159.1 hypothetical protein [Acidimicrobiia bacterium]
MSARLFRLVLIAAVLGLTLAACGGGSSDTTLPGGDPTTTADGTGGGGTTTTALNRIPDEARTDLPEDFPTEEIPLIGEVVRGGGSDGIWIVVVRAEGTVDQVREEAGQALLDAGFEAEDQIFTPYHKGPYTVVIQAAPEEGGAVLVNYQISTRPGS